MARCVWGVRYTAKPLLLAVWGVRVAGIGVCQDRCGDAVLGGCRRAAWTGSDRTRLADVLAGGHLTCSRGTMLGAGGTDPSCPPAAAAAAGASPGARRRLPPLPAPCGVCAAGPQTSGRGGKGRMPALCDTPCRRHPAAAEGVSGLQTSWLCLHSTTQALANRTLPPSAGYTRLATAGWLHQQAAWADAISSSLAIKIERPFRGYWTNRGVCCYCCSWLKPQLLLISNGVPGS